jgi:hypothetical protein
MTATAPAKPRASLGWVLDIAAAAALIVALDQLVVATALQTIRETSAPPWPASNGPLSTRSASASMR